YCLPANFELEHWNYRAQVGVAAALAVSIDSALHLRRAVLNRRYRVGNSHIRIIMSMDSDWRLELPADLVDYLHQSASQRAAVRITEHYRVGAGLVCRPECFDGESRVSGKAIKEVLCVVDYLAALGFQVRDRSPDQVNVFLERDSQRFFYMKVPALADYRDHRRLSLD